MNNKKTILAAAFAAIAITAVAMPGGGAQPRHSGPHGGAAPSRSDTFRGSHGNNTPPRNSFHVSHGKSTPQHDSFHDTYRKNTGEIRREAPKPVNNIHAKISAARIEELERELERERAHKSPISCWSNFGSFSTVSVAQSPSKTVEQKSINIVNSYVTINQ